MRLPTVKMRHPRTGKVRKINQTDYARDLGAWDGWVVMSWAHGNAPDDVVERAARAAEKELARAANPAHPASRDGARALAERAISVGVKTTDEDWRGFPWFKRRAHVKGLTGVMPQSAGHAEALMAAGEGDKGENS